MCNNEKIEVIYKNIIRNNADNGINITATVNNYNYNWIGNYKKNDEKNTYIFDGIIIETNTQGNKKLYIISFNDIKYKISSKQLSDSINTSIIKTCKIKNILIACHCNTFKKHDELFIIAAGFKESLYVNKSHHNIEYIDPEAGCGEWLRLKNGYYDIIWTVDCPSYRKVINHDANKKLGYGHHDFDDLLDKGPVKLSDGGIIIIPYGTDSIIDEKSEVEVNNYNEFLNDHNKNNWSVKLIKSKKFPFCIEKNISPDYLMILTPPLKKSS